jgi:lactate dehydrogenase-like 2-hydroxyacid dehydrogenase
VSEVYVTRRVPGEAIAMLRDGGCAVRQWDHDEPVPYEVLSEVVPAIDGLYCLLTDRIDAALMDRGLPRLKVISQMAVGFDNIDIGAATSRRLPVGHTPGVLTETTADLTWALLMCVARRLVEAAAAVKDGSWTTWLPMWMTGPDVHGSTLGIVGAGRIGVAMTRRAQGFGMRVLYTDAVASPQAEALGATRRELPELLAESDFVTLHTPLLPETRHLVNEAFLRQMKPTAILVNTSRGPVVDEAALHRALSEGWIRAAGLDVTEVEPLPLDSPLLALPNCLVLPHIGSASEATRTRMATMAAENLLAGLRGERLPYCVNCDALDA